MTLLDIRGQMMGFRDTAATHYVVVIATAKQQPMVNCQDSGLSQGSCQGSAWLKLKRKA